MINKPIIGVTLDWENSLTYSAMHPWYALRTNYTSCISENGGVAITLPYDLNAAEQYIAILDGLVITGGDYDLDPSVYGESLHAETRDIKNNRTDFEMALIKAALRKNIPILAICAGEQLLSAMHGGKLMQDIHSFNPNALEHEQKNLGLHMSKPSHNITITPGSLLHKIVQKEEFMVNSSHHQAVKSVGPAMIISAVAPDGIIEAVEMPEYNFVLGVEWHPEYLGTKEDLLIFQAFINAAKKTRTNG
jgi:putative glutamine amidotransferase